MNTRKWSAATQVVLLSAGIISLEPAVAAVSIYGGISKSGGFSICLQKGGALADAQGSASAGCKGYPDNTCVEVASCSGGGYASAVFT